MKNIALRLKYLGTRYHGWQVQKSEITVAGTLERALSEVCGHPVKLTGCGRTDAGVHALKYCANFKTTSGIPVDRLPLAVNTVLPPDIVVTGAVHAEDDFNAILSCEKKEYTYKIFNSRIRDPFLTERVYFYPKELDVAKMAEGAGQIVGTHDFAALRSVGTETKTTVRTVFWYEVEKINGIIELRACADGFLYNMARAMAGTLIYVSEGKIIPAEIPMLLEKRDRTAMGPTVPPGGLYLTRLWYGGIVGEMMSE